MWHVRGIVGLSFLMSALVLAPTLGTSAAADDTRGRSSAQVEAATRIRVGSFNVRTVRSDLTPTPNEAPWRERRTEVIADILGERVDVLGLQEASQNARYRDLLVSGTTQYLDLRNGLNAQGGSYQLTDAQVKSSRDTRILYDTSRVSMVRQGHYEYQAQSSGPHDQRFLVWAEFEVKESGERFFFANTHLVTGSGDLQRAQWLELIDRVNALRGDLPTVVVGDFQRSKFKQPAAEMMARMEAAGYGDVVGQQPAEARSEDPRAQRLRRAWMNSMNGFNRDVTEWSYESDRTKVGNNCDWIFASNYLPVRKWKVVADIDPETLTLEGVIPSDHNMVRATIELR